MPPRVFIAALSTQRELPLPKLYAGSPLQPGQQPRSSMTASSWLQPSPTHSQLSSTYKRRQQSWQSISNCQLSGSPAIATCSETNLQTPNRNSGQLWPSPRLRQILPPIEPLFVVCRPSPIQHSRIQKVF